MPSIGQWTATRNAPLRRTAPPSRHFRCPANCLPKLRRVGNAMRLSGALRVTLAFLFGLAGLGILVANSGTAASVRQAPSPAASQQHGLGDHKQGDRALHQGSVGQRTYLHAITQTTMFATLTTRE